MTQDKINDGLLVTPLKTGTQNEENESERVPSFQTVEELAAWLARANDIRFVDFTFSDAVGSWHQLTYEKDECVADALNNGFGFDGSSIKCFCGIQSSDMLLKPDPTACWADPFNEGTLHVMCVVANPDGQPSNRCPRQIALRAVRTLLESGIADRAVFGPEPEFFLFDHAAFQVTSNIVRFEVDAEGGLWNSGRCRGQNNRNNLAHRVGPKHNYMPMAPIDRDRGVRCEILRQLRKIGVHTEKHHGEAANAQHEIGFKFSDLVSTADNLQAMKYIVRQVAGAHGKTATFMPKPLVADNGSGCHIHHSLWQDGRNLFYDPGDSYAQLSNVARWYVGGILAHAPAVMAFSNATTNSYKRLVPGFEAPIAPFYSRGNRTAAIRIPMGGNAEKPHAKRIETRFPDGSGNPYLSLSALLLAGLDGVKRQLEPPPPLDEDVTSPPRLTAQQPRCLEDALNALNEDREFLRPAFTDDFIDVYLALKREEVAAVNAIVHPKEYELYYHL